MADPVRIDLPVFLHDGDVAIGAVRAVHQNSLDIYVENSGDFVVPVSAIQDVHSDKVVLDGRKLDKKLREAIAKAHAAEDDEPHAPVDD